MPPRKKQQLPDITPSDLDRLVVLSGPRNCLPAAACCIRRSLPPKLSYFRPVVEVRDGSDRLYSKYNLPLFEVIVASGETEQEKTKAGSAGFGSSLTSKTTAASNAKNTNGGDNISSDSDSGGRSGPAAAVLRRRRSGLVTKSIGSNHAVSGGISQTKQNKMKQQQQQEMEIEKEDVSDDHYRKLHRKPEYVEKRIRNREIELYQYSRWQENIISEALRELDSAASDDNDAGDGGANKRPRQRRRKELLALMDSVGFQKAQQQIQLQNQQQQQNGGTQQAAPSPLCTAKKTKQQQPITKKKKKKEAKQAADHSQTAESASAVPSENQHYDRKLAHLGGVVLEQFLVQASRFPPEPPEALDADAADSQTRRSHCHPCCPRDFELPPRLYNQVIKQRKINSD
ncbi:hypothetical protein LPJ72_003400 [Coemansia sp. Benny D160-2]|nr:hypothetical protein LPJ72_003400 [Coemansia sp. Benny D160-2]